MKKIQKWMLAAILICGTTLSAQAQDTKHEIAVSYGQLSNSDWMNVFDEILTAPFNGSGKSDSKNENYFGPLAVEYFYNLNKVVGIGGIFTIGHYSYDLYRDDVFQGEVNNNYYTLMPAAKFNWLRSTNFGMYSKLAIGATYRTEKDEHIDYSDNSIHLNWQVSFIGIEGGLSKFRVFAELGFGEQGVLLGGLRYKF